MLTFSVLLANTNRSKAYLQNLTRKGYLPAEALLLADPKQILPEQRLDRASTRTPIRTVSGLDARFDETEPLLDTLTRHHIDYRLINTLNVNDPEVIRHVRNTPADMILYSGPGGSLLKPELLTQGKTFLHAHPGWLPEYKGSTTVYYSMLIDGTVGCSMIYLNQQIDSGPIVYKKAFRIPKGILDMDLTFDPLIRTETLLEFLHSLQEAGQWPTAPETAAQPGHTFYIVHPVLKHIAILKQRRG